MPRSHTLTAIDAIRGCQDLSRHSIHQVITSPPYWGQKNYGPPEQLGWTGPLEQYLAYLGQLFIELRRVCDPSATLFVVIGDTIRNSTCMLVPQRVSILLAENGWNVKNTIVWQKLDAAPKRIVKQWRPVHEHILFASLDPKKHFFFDDAIRVPHSPRTLRRWGRGQTYGGPKSGVSGPSGQAFSKGKSFNLHPLGAIAPDVMSHATSRASERHYATFPRTLIESLLLAGSPPGGTVLDPFCGTATTGAVALSHGRKFVGFDLNPEYIRIASARLDQLDNHE